MEDGNGFGAKKPYGKKDSTVDTAIEEIGARLTRRQIIKEASAAFSQHISRQPHVQRLFSFMPTLMTRVSPFHFRDRNRFKDWPLVRLDSRESNSWGQMSVVGELLIIFDETILLGLLSLMNRYKRDVFQTSLKELCVLSQIDPTTKTCNAIWKSIQRLAGTRIDLDLRSGKGKKRKAVKAMTGSILSYGDIDRESGVIRVVINPYFLEMYAESFVTNIDLKFRAELKSDVSKALYRFFQGQMGAEISIEMLKLAAAVNLHKDQEKKKLQSKIRAALRELAAKGYLKTFEISGEGLISITKAGETATNIGSQILGSEKFHISKIRGPMGES